MCGRGILSPKTLFAALAIVLLLMAGIPSVQADETTWSWTAPSGYDGAAAVRVMMDFGTDNVCDIELAGIGNGDGPYLFFGFGDDWWFYLRGSTIAQVHDEESGFDTRTVYPGGGAFGIHVIHSGAEWSGVRPLTVFNADSYMSDDEPSTDWIPPLEIHVDCEKAVTPVSFSGSQEAISFSRESMDGTGASVEFFGRNAAVSDGDAIQATLESEETRAFIHVEDRAVSHRTWSLEAPNGDTTGSSGVSVETKDWRFVDAGPGTWTFELSEVAVNSVADGWFAGFPPVDSLDDVFA